MENDKNESIKLNETFILKRNINNINVIWWNILFIYLPPLILVQGIIGNLISFYVFFKLGKLKNKFKPDQLIKLSKLIITSMKTSNVNDNNIITNKNQLSINKQNNDAINKTKKINNNNNNNRIQSTPGGLTIYLYLCLLAIFDLGVLLFGLLNEWIYSLTLFDLKNHSLFICKLFTFFAYLFSHLSSSTIVITTAIRLIAIYRPLYASNLTTIKFVKLISFIQFLSFTLINIHLFWNMNLIQLDYHTSTTTSPISSDVPQSTSILPILNFTQESKSDGSYFIKLFLFQQQQNISTLEQKNNSFYNNNDNDYNYIEGSHNVDINDDNEIITINNFQLKQCKIKTNIFTKSVWPIADKLIYCILPFLFITLFNILIIINISKVQKYKYTLYVSKLKNDLIIQHQQQQQQQQQSSFHESIHNNNELTSSNANNQILNDELNEGSNNNNNKKDLIIVYKQQLQQQSISAIINNQQQLDHKIDIKEKIIQFKKYHLVGKKFTILLLAISFSFLVLTFPVVLTYLLIDPLTKKFDKMEINESNFNFEIFGYIQKITELLMYLNHSVNFYIYFITSFRFRQQFKLLFKSSSNYHHNNSRNNNKYIFYFKCCFSNHKQKTHLYD